MTILPSSYLPAISYFVAILSGDCTIDIGEHYIKRSPRNRTRIMTAQGVMELSIPIKKANRPQSAMHSMEIDYSKRWQHQHWITILSAYKSSPFFDHYAPYFEAIYRREYRLLTEFNYELIKLITKLLQLPLPEVSKDYIKAESGDIDLRPKGTIESHKSVEPYIQVFFDREPFEANLSIIDLLFCEGPNARVLLMASHR
ncbi:MAG: WbqC family protein [Rikenellaceae bacterium]